MAATLPEHDRFVAGMRRFEENAVWAMEHRAEYQEYLDQFIAVDERRIVGVADDPDELYKQFAGRLEVYITWVGPPGLAWVL